MYTTMKLALLAILFSSFSFFVKGQNEMIATRVNSQIKIDGNLDEDAWAKAEPSTSFTQFEPRLDAEPSFKTEVRLIYDDKGIYLGAKLYQDPSTILKELSPRDQRGNTDWFGMTLDPYGSGLNGFAFIVTASGVQQDVRLTLDDEDTNWDAVWESDVKVTEEGWNVEMKIPYSAIRFPKKNVQNWKLQFAREVRFIREQIFWNKLDPNVEGFVNQCGHLKGIENIKSPVRLSLTPFVVGYVDHLTNEGSSTAFSAGMDLKYGINDAFTLDMTLIPDFGQVISDNVVVNLGPFEQFFEENRQFFTEGVELFNKGNLFYTRRIGGRPLKYFDAFDTTSEEEVVTNPQTSSLINASKITGRTASGMGIGVFNAIVGEEYATIRNNKTGVERQLQTNPLTNYNVFVLDQNLANNSVVSFVNTNALRFGDDYDANVTGGFFDLKNKSQQYGIRGKVVVSQKYFADSDADIGHTYALGFGKIGGAWRSTFNYSVETDNYDHNDVGFLFSPNERRAQFRVESNQFKPKNKKLVRWNMFLSPVYERLYKPDVFTNLSIRGGGFLVTANRLGTGFNFNIEPIKTNDYFEPRTSDFSRFYKFPVNWRIGGFVSTDYRKTIALDVRANYRKYYEDGRQDINFEIEPRVRFNNKLSLIGTISYGEYSKQVGYLSTNDLDVIIPGLEDGILFGIRDRDIFENSLRLNYIFTNNMSLSVRLRHYWDRFIYGKYSILEEDGSLRTLSYNGQDSNGDAFYDSNFNIFNIDLFYTWRFAPGSDIVFAYKNAVSKSDDRYERNYLGNLVNLFDANQFNSFSLRVIYFLDYQSIVPNPS